MFSQIKNLFSISFELSHLKNEAEILDFLHKRTHKDVLIDLDDFLFDNFLKSHLHNYRELLLNLSKFGLKSYTNWRLLFPIYPRIDIFQNPKINEKLAVVEERMISTLLKILLFLRDNFERDLGDKQNILLPFFSEKVLDKKFSTFNSDFKIGWYENYLKRLEKIMVLKVLYYNNFGEVAFLYKQNLAPQKSDSNLAKHIYFKNTYLVEYLTKLIDRNTLENHLLISELTSSLHNNDKVDYAVAFIIEEQFSAEFSRNKIKFEEKYIPQVFSALESYFSEQDQEKLMTLISGEVQSSKRKLVFQQTSVSLTYFFKCLHEDKVLISTSKKHLANWIINNFQCLHNQIPIDIKLNTVEKNLKPDSKPPKLILSLD